MVPIRSSLAATHSLVLLCRMEKPRRHFRGWDQSTTFSQPFPRGEEQSWRVPANEQMPVLTRVFPGETPRFLWNKGQAWLLRPSSPWRAGHLSPFVTQLSHLAKSSFPVSKLRAVWLTLRNSCWSCRHPYFCIEALAKCWAHLQGGRYHLCRWLHLRVVECCYHLLSPWSSSDSL